MSSIIQKLKQKNLINPPSFLPTNTMYECMMGSMAYGTSIEFSDVDIYGWCIPPKEVVFPHLSGHIEGFSRQTQKFEQYQKHHVQDKQFNKEYDLTIYNIVKYFRLCMDNNPNMIDSMFVPADCVLHTTPIAEKVRLHRHDFLHKGCFHKFRGYAFAQLSKADSPNRTGKRKADMEEYGYDRKFLMHVVRLSDECEQILQTGTLDLRRNKEHLKAIRRGEIGIDEVRKWFLDKERYLEKLYHNENSPIPYSPNEDKIKALLLQCLESHYGTLENCITHTSREQSIVNDLQALVRKYNL